MWLSFRNITLQNMTGTLLCYTLEIDLEEKHTESKD